MGRLFPYAKARAGAGESAIAHFKEAARADTSSSLVWEMLGEMLSTSDPAGKPYACISRELPLRMNSMLIISCHLSSTFQVR